MPLVEKKCLLTTGPPWGFRVHLDTDNILTISKIRRHSPAEIAKLRSGDHVISINGKLASRMKHGEAINLIETSVGTLEVHVSRFESTSTQILIFDKIDSSIDKDVKTEMNLNLIRPEASSMESDLPDETPEPEELFKESTPQEPQIRPSSPDVQPISLSKLIHEYDVPDDSDNLLHKKKQFADSSFYNDPYNLYPTTEEIMEMARRVASSLYAPDNKSSKGASIFEKQRKRADKYTLQNEETNANIFVTDEIKYDLAHWPEVLDRKERSPSPIYRLGYSSGQVIPPPPPPPPAPNEAKTIQEFMEKVQKFPKATHNVVSPDVCFDIAAALHSSDSRGAQIFAKQKHRAQKWTLTAPETVSTQPMFATVPGPSNKLTAMTFKDSTQNNTINKQNQNKLFHPDQINPNQNMTALSRKPANVFLRNSNQGPIDAVTKINTSPSITNESNLSAATTQSVPPAAKWKPVKFNVPQRA